MIEALVAFCVRRPWFVVIMAALVTGLALFVTITRFAINTDTARLISPEVDWRKNEIAFDRAFPQRVNLIVAVIDGETPEIADEAADKLAAALAGKPALFTSVTRPDAGPFFARNGLLFLSPDDLARTTAQLGEQKDLLEILASDPSLRGSVNMLGTALTGVQFGSVKLDELARPFTDFAAVFEKAVAGQRARLSWQRLFARGEPNPSDLRRLILIKPVLDFNALQPGALAAEELRRTAGSLGLTAANGVNLRLTGQVPLADEEFATVAENLWLNIGGTIAAVTVILFMALRFGSIILAVLITLFVGLITTSGLGLLVVGELNLISVAFAVLFIGLGVDFGIQYAVRYRAERHADSDLRVAVRRAGKSAGGALTLAAISLVVGFLSFLPTEFRGVSELGLIAGMGMVVAYLASLTVLPALLVLMKPPAEKASVQTNSLAGIDHWIANHRRFVLIATAVVVLAGAPLLFKLSFDSNPMNLRSQKIESVATYLDLTRNPDTNPSSIEIVAPSLSAAADLTPRLAALADVARVVTLATFVPEDQDRKRAIIAKAAADLAAVFNPPQPSPAATDAETVQALRDVAEDLRAAKGPAASPGIEAAKRLAGAMERLAEAAPDRRKAAETAVITDFRRLVGQLRAATDPEQVTRDTLPRQLVEEWVASDGRARMEVFAKGDSNDNAVIRRFVAAVRTIAPDATGALVSISESGHTVVRAFMQAGLFALVAITLILWIALRRLRDVLLTLGPLVLAGLMTLEAAYLVGLPLNFANIIAMPLMFGVGVAFHIYYIIAWRAGVADMLASSLTRAIFFSALTTGTAFGSLWLSSHPGTASMGELLAISLLFTLLAAFIIVPAFLGPPPVEGERSGSNFGH